jgi:hypothetical protein
MADCPLVIVRWLDSRQPCGQWRYLSALPEARPVEVASVGWLVKDTAEVKVICQNVGDLDHPEKAQASGIMTIPTRCVIAVEKLTEEESLSTASAGPESAGPDDLNGFEGSGDFAGFAAISDDLRIASEPTRQAL